MTKLDFAIQLFIRARTVTNGATTRTPVVTLLVLFLLARRPGEWMTGTYLAEGITGISSSTISTTIRSAVHDGLIEKRPIEGASHGALEWRITPAGQRIVAKLLTTETPAAAA